jgi:hypothetical protein
MPCGSRRIDMFIIMEVMFFSLHINLMVIGVVLFMFYDDLLWLVGCVVML